MISFIIPAYNEEMLIARTLQTLRASAEAVLGDQAFEVIVVNDDSTDRTAQIASEHGARVVNVKCRQIAAVRNAGAKQANGDVFIFIDADTLVPPQPLQGAMDALRRGAVGGGSYVKFGGRVSIFGRMYFHIFLLVWRPLKLAAGCFVFVRRAAFEAVGGFDERFYASEEIWLSKALKTQGQFVIVPIPVITSGRKLRMFTMWQMLAISVRLLWKGPQSWQTREGLELWYDGQRENAATDE